MTMPSPPITLSKQRIRMQMLDQLAQLDRLGEHVAAAHLAAAIDALDDRLAPSGTPRRSRKPESDGAVAPLDLMAQALADHMGPRARHVARRQMADATGDVLLTWAAIANRVDEIQDEGSDER